MEGPVQLNDPGRSRAALVVSALLAVLSTDLAASAQPPPAQPPAPPDAAAEAKKEEARGYFQKGLALFDDQAWDAALVQFQRSREIYPTRAATKNAAFCLQRLHRFDEALEMYETLVRDYPNMSAEDKVSAAKSIADLGSLVGTIELRGAEPGASIVIGGRDRGVSPPPGPIRVSIGTHVVRVYKEGFLPFETRVEVSGGRTTKVEARLGALTQGGRLRITEQMGKTVDVLVDGVVVGKTPWEGTLAAGEHTVVLRGLGNLGTQPVTAPVNLNQLTPLTVGAEELEAALRIEPVPAGASVALDGVTVGRGVWEGRLRAGGHQVEITADGFQPSTLQIKVDKNEHQVMNPKLVRLLRGGSDSRFTVELDGAAAIAPSLGGAIVGGCSGSCSHGLGIGPLLALQGGYQLGNGLGFGLTVGYLSAAQSVKGRQATVLQVGGNQSQTTADDSLRLSGVLVGATAGYHLDTKLPLLFRLGAGALIGSLRDDRSGKFTASDGSPNVTDSPKATYFYAAPEVRVGVKLGGYVELSAGIAGLVLVALSQPVWSNGKEQTIFDGKAFGSFGAQELAGKTLFLLAPSAGVRVAF
jgi:hypothetical protein